MKSASESNVQSRVRLEAHGLNARAWRNNVGVLKDANGRPVRYGLANDSSNLNAVLKSGDLIGGVRRLITPDMIGSTLLQFLSLECKPEGWVYTGTEREVAQASWRDLILQDGGCAGFVTGPSDFVNLVRTYTGVRR